MKVKDINELDKVINENHGCEGLWMLFDNLIRYNPTLNYDSTKSAFIELLRFMLNKNYIKLASVYTDKQNIWEGPTEEILTKLKAWFPTENDWNFRTDSSWKMYFFDYPFIIWLKDYPINLELSSQN